MVKSMKHHTQKLNSVFAHKDFLVSASDDATIKVTCNTAHGLY